MFLESGTPEKVLQSVQASRCVAVVVVMYSFACPVERRRDHLSRCSSEFAQEHIACLSFTESLARGCISVYDPGGILPVWIIPQIDSSSLRLLAAE
jgi:hypothetical protein